MTTETNNASNASTETAKPIANFDPTATYASGDKFQIKFDGKPITVSHVRAGVVQKTASIFYIRDCVTGEWLYCFPQRLENMIKKGVDLANYKGRDTKASERKAQKIQAVVNKEAKAKAAQEAAAAALLKIQTTVGPEVQKVPETPKSDTVAEAPKSDPAPEAPTAPVENLADVAAREEAAAKATKKAAKK